MSRFSCFWSRKCLPYFITIHFLLQPDVWDHTLASRLLSLAPKGEVGFQEGWKHYSDYVVQIHCIIRLKLVITDSFHAVLEIVRCHKWTGGTEASCPTWSWWTKQRAYGWSWGKEPLRIYILHRLAINKAAAIFYSPWWTGTFSLWLFSLL